MKYTILVGGWATPLKNMKVSWDDEIPNIYIYIWGTKNVPNHQPASILGYLWESSKCPTPLPCSATQRVHLWSTGSKVSALPCRAEDAETTQRKRHEMELNDSGWWLGHPSTKYESQLGWLFPIYGKIKLMFQTTNQDFLLNPIFSGNEMVVSWVMGVPPGHHPFRTLGFSMKYVPPFMETSQMRWLKKTYKSAILLFTLSRNYFGSDLLNTIKDMFCLFGGNLHGGVIRGRWCLKLVFGQFLLSFLLSFCVT